MNTANFTVALPPAETVQTMASLFQENWELGAAEMLDQAFDATLLGAEPAMAEVVPPMEVQVDRSLFALRPAAEECSSHQNREAVPNTMLPSPSLRLKELKKMNAVLVAAT